MGGMESPPIQPQQGRWWLPLLIPAVFLTIGFIGGVDGGTRVVHQGPADAIGSAVAAVLVVGWPFFAAGTRRQRSRSTERAGTREPEVAASSESETVKSASARFPGTAGWYQKNGRWYCEEHNVRYCKICSS